MPITPDIGNPANGQTVGPGVTVLGSYSGTSDNTFTIKCKVENNLASKYSKEVDATVDGTQKTWQATFSGLPASSKLDEDSLYTVTATVAESGLQLHPPALRPTGTSGSGSVRGNPVLEVFVEDPPPIDIDLPPELAIRSGPNMLVEGSYRPGYGWEEGYTMYAYVTTRGVRVSSHERLVSMADGRWGCQMHLAPDQESEETAINAELWRRNTDETYPVVVVSRLLTRSLAEGKDLPK